MPNVRACKNAKIALQHPIIFGVLASPWPTLKTEKRKKMRFHGKWKVSLDTLKSFQLVCVDIDILVPCWESTHFSLLVAEISEQNLEQLRRLRPLQGGWGNRQNQAEGEGRGRRQRFAHWASSGLTERKGSFLSVRPEEAQWAKRCLLPLPSPSAWYCHYTLFQTKPSEATHQSGKLDLRFPWQMKRLLLINRVGLLAWEQAAFFLPE